MSVITHESMLEVVWNCVLWVCVGGSDCTYESLSWYIYISVACVHAQSLFAHVWAKKCMWASVFSSLEVHLLLFRWLWISLYLYVCICVHLHMDMSVFISGFLLTRQLNRLCLTAQQKLNSYSHSSHNSRELTPDSSRPGDSWYMCVYER